MDICCFYTTAANCAKYVQPSIEARVDMDIQTVHELTVNNGFHCTASFCHIVLCDLFVLTVGCFQCCWKKRIYRKEDELYHLQLHSLPVKTQHNTNSAAATAQLRVQLVVVTASLLSDKQVGALSRVT